MLFTDTFKKLSAFLAALLLMLVTVGCDREGENIPTSFPTVSSLKIDGWSYFENAQYTDAITSFNGAKNRNATDIDAYNGLGWSYARVSDYSNAESNFKLMMSLSTSADILADAYAGLALMNFATPRDLAVSARNARDSVAIDFIDKVFALKSNYAFTHDDRINAKMLYKVVAQIRFNRGEYLKCVQEIEQNLVSNYFQTLLDKGLVKKMETDTTVVTVLSETQVTGKAVLNLSVESDGATRAAELVDIIAVKDLTQNVTYEVLSFTEGKQQVTFRGNPIPQKDDKFLVDYYYAPDFGLVLAELMQVLQ
jgi:tetratricopeptide (TPR) repeat protein